MRPFFIALACSWVGLFGVARFYSQQHPNSHWIMAAALPAFLIEAVFYLGTLFEEPRIRFAMLEQPRVEAALLWLSGLLPYVVFSVAAGTFQRNAFYLLCLLCGTLSFWQAILPRRLAYDVGFLVIAAAPLITGVFKRIYISPDSLKMDILGHLMWIRIGVAAILILREWEPGAFGLWPLANEWRIGALWFLAAVVPLIGLAEWIGDVHYSPVRGAWWLILVRPIAYFFGSLWVVSLPEELFFRGIIEKAMLDTWRSPVVAIAVSTLLYGSVHLWFHEYPNWRHSLVVLILGGACGIAYWQSKSVRAPMVTHALAVVTWRTFFA